MEYPKYSFIPIKKKHSNKIFKAPADMPECADLNATIYRQDGFEHIASIWKLGSFWQRLKFLFKGEITLIVTSYQLPPLSINCGDIIRVQDE